MPTRKTGRGGGKKRPSQAKDTTVTTGAGKSAYKITVKKGSPYAKLAKKLGSVPKSFRSGSFNKSNDPYAAGISPSEKKSRMKSYGNKSTYKKSSRKKM